MRLVMSSEDELVAVSQMQWMERRARESQSHSSQQSGQDCGPSCESGKNECGKYRSERSQGLVEMEQQVRCGLWEREAFPAGLERLSVPPPWLCLEWKSHPILSRSHTKFSHCCQ